MLDLGCRDDHRERAVAQQRRARQRALDELALRVRGDR